MFCQSKERFERGEFFENSHKTADMKIEGNFLKRFLYKRYIQRRELFETFLNPKKFLKRNQRNIWSLVILSQNFGHWN